MSDWIGLAVIVIVIVGALWGMSHLGRTRPEISVEEFERRVAESRGSMSSGVSGLMYALQKLINPKAAEAVEILKDMKAGYYDDSEKVGDGSDAVGDEGDDTNAGENASPVKPEQVKLSEGEDA
jgi:hypothetical protein